MKPSKWTILWGIYVAIGLTLLVFLQLHYGIR